MWDVDCVPRVAVACGGSYAGTTTGFPHEADGYSCNPFGYPGGDRAHVLQPPPDVSVQGTVSGLSAQLDLMLVETSGGGCDSALCATPSTLAGTSDATISFLAQKDQAYHLVVDGYNGAESPSTLR